MSSKLIDLLTKMGENLDLQHAFAEDPEKVMSQGGLSDDEKAALRSGDERVILQHEQGIGQAILCKLILRIPRPG